MSISIKSLKLILAGDKQVGKSSFINTIKTGKFYSNYTPTDGIAIDNININTNLGTYSFDILEISTNPHNHYRIYDYYRKAHCAIIMFDLTNSLGIMSLKKYYDIIRNINIDIPIVFVGNKCDERDEYGVDIAEYKLNDILSNGQNPADKTSFKLYEVSAKTGKGLSTPFFKLLKRVVGVANLNVFKIKPHTIIEDPTNRPIEKLLDLSIDKSTKDTTSNAPQTLQCLTKGNSDTSFDRSNIMNLMNLKNSIIMDIVSKHREHVNIYFCYSITVHARPSIISRVAKQIFKNTDKVVGMYIPLNYKETTNFGICFIEYRGSKETLAALDNPIMKSLETEYDFTVEKCDSNGPSEKLLISLVVNDDIFEYADNRMVTIKGIPVIENKRTNTSRILLLRQTLHATFSKYGNIVHSYLPLNDEKTSTMNYYVIEYANDSDVQRVINNEHQNHWGEHILTVSKFNDTI